MHEQAFYAITAGGVFGPNWWYFTYHGDINKTIFVMFCAYSNNVTNPMPRNVKRYWYSISTPRYQKNPKQKLKDCS